MLRITAVVCLCVASAAQSQVSRDKRIDEAIQIEQHLLGLVQAKDYINAVPLAEKAAALRSQVGPATDSALVTGQHKPLAYPAASG